MQRIRERLGQVTNWKQLSLRALGGIVVLLLLFQIFYPGNRLLPLASIDGMNLGWQTKADATAKLNAAYDAHPVSIYMGPGDKPLVTPTLGTAKLDVDNTERINDQSYAWYARLIPTSILWAHIGRSEVPKPTLAAGHEKYVDTKLMSECKKPPTNASLKAKDGKLGLVKAIPGGECKKEEVEKTLKSVQPVLDKPTEIRVALKVLPPVIDDADATTKQKDVESIIGDNLAIVAGGEVVNVPAAEVNGWLDFAEAEGELLASVNQERSNAYISKSIAPKVTVAPGVSRITTRDFTEISRVNGSNGQALNMPATLASIGAYINGGAEKPSAIVTAVPPREEYTRTYSPTDAGLSALLANYAKDHPGTFGISLIELSGKGRRASYNGDKQFVTASTYKLFVAYSVLRRIDNGQMSWDAESTCFNKMISLSDNTCAEAYLSRIGLTTITKEINALGLKNSNFTKVGGPYTTANDLTLLLGMIESGQNFSPSNRLRLINAMQGNIYRQGIPAGANGTVADKVGFLDKLLHDAAIVYSPNGTYVLAVMTDGSSWSTIADLARQIDTLRAQ